MKSKQKNQNKTEEGTWYMKSGDLGQLSIVYLGDLG